MLKPKKSTFEFSELVRKQVASAHKWY